MTVTFARFLLVGLVNTCATLLLIFLAMGVLGMGEVPANALGYSLGLASSFFLNRSWTFKHEGALTKALPAFVLVQALAYSLNLLCVLCLIDLGVDAYFAQALGIPPYTLASFLGSRYLVFAKADPVD